MLRAQIVHLCTSLLIFLSFIVKVPMQSSYTVYHGQISRYFSGSLPSLSFIRLDVWKIQHVVHIHLISVGTFN